AIVIDDIAILISGVLLVAGAEGVWRVHQIEIDMFQLQPFAAALNRRLDSLRPMIVIPQLRRDEQVAAFDPAGMYGLLNCLPYLQFIAIALRAIEVADPGLNCCLSGSSCKVWIGNERAEAQCGYLPCSAAKRQPAISETVGWCHDFSLVKFAHSLARAHPRR